MGTRQSEQGSLWVATARLIGRAFDVLAHLDQITIGAINGYAVGGGWSFALAFDFAIAVEGAEFWVPEVDLEVPYRGAPASVLAARLGPWRAKEAILMCRHYRAEELLAMGALNRVVKPDGLMPAGRKYFVNETQRYGQIRVLTSGCQRMRKPLRDNAFRCFRILADTSGAVLKTGGATGPLPPPCLDLLGAYGDLHNPRIGLSAHLLPTFFTYFQNILSPSRLLDLRAEYGAKLRQNFAAGCVKRSRGFESPLSARAGGSSILWVIARVVRSAGWRPSAIALTILGARNASCITRRT